MNKKILIITLIFVLLIGCTKKEQTNALKFKEEYEKYNNTKIKLEISEDNIIKYATKKEINEIIKTKSGVIFIGSPQDDLSRVAIKYLLDASESTDLEKIYYTKDASDIEEIEDTKIPIVIYVLDGKIVSTHNGTIKDKTKLSEDEEIELYNIYMDGIHKVLQDACDEEC